MIREFYGPDIYDISVQQEQREFAESCIDEIFELSGASYTYLELGRPKAAFGAIPIWQGRAAVWAIIGDNINNWVSFHRSVKSQLNQFCKDNSMRRMELTTRVGFDESERWARMLDFKYESTMPLYDAEGNDHKMWVMTWQQLQS